MLNGPLESVRESTLIQRFNDLYARERLNAMDILRTVSADYDLNQRICFTVVQVKTEEIQWSLEWLEMILRKHFQWLNDVLQNGNYVFVLNWR